jgi:hypothetical protein
VKSLLIDVERFALLTAAIATTNCRAAEPPAPPPPPAVTAEAPAEPPPVAASEAPLEVAEDADDAGSVAEKPKLDCDNDVGDVNCDWVDPRRYSGPACEGFAGTCDLLKKGYGYRLRVAAEAARCFAKKGAAACNIFVRNKCLRAATAVACPDLAFAEDCEAALQRCKSRHQKPNFTKDECIKVLSSLEGRELDWARGAIGPSAEGCKIMYPVY